MPETSIIIRTFNEEKYLPGLLKAIREQTYRDFELIVVDSGSVDGTRDVAEEYCDKLIRVERQDFTFGHSLNVGIQHGNCPFIAIISAHTKPIGESWLARLIEPLRGDRTAMVFGRQMGWRSSKFSEIQDFQRIFVPGRETRKPPHFVVNNGNSAVRRDLWERRGFDEVLPGLEDIEWAKHWVERDYEVVYEPKAAIFHIHEETWPQVQRRYYREGVAARRIGFKSRQGIPLELLSDGENLALDLFQARMDGCLIDKSWEVVQFRFRKTAGTIKGLLDGAMVNDVKKRQTLYFDKACKSYGDPISRPS